MKRVKKSRAKKSFRNLKKIRTINLTIFFSILSIIVFAPYINAAYTCYYGAACNYGGDCDNPTYGQSGTCTDCSYWNIGGLGDSTGNPAGGATLCCGDDAGEYPTSDDEYLTGSIPWEGDNWACCNANDCLLNKDPGYGECTPSTTSSANYGSTTYYVLASSILYSNYDNKAFCYGAGGDDGGAGWLDCDLSGWYNNWCRGQCGPPYPACGSSCGTKGGATVVVGEYDTTPGDTECCGDDYGEYYRSFSQNAANGCNDITDENCVGKDDTIVDRACCLAEEGKGCSFNNLCYYGWLGNAQMADVDGDGVEGEYCRDAEWYDCDKDSTSCTHVYYCGDEGTKSYYWVAGGETVTPQFGEYDTGTSTECCGDDAGEYYKAGSATLNEPRCCNNPTDCVDSNNVCRLNTFNSGGWLCDAGTWIRCTSAETCDEYGGKYCQGLFGWMSGSSDGERELSCSECRVCGGTSALNEGDLSCNAIAADGDVHVCGGAYTCSGLQTRLRNVCVSGACAARDASATDCSGNCNSACSAGVCQDTTAGQDPYGICSAGYSCTGQQITNGAECGSGTGCGHLETTCAGTTCNYCNNAATCATPGSGTICNTAYACTTTLNNNGYNLGGTPYATQGYCDGGGTCDWAGASNVDVNSDTCLCYDGTSRYNIGGEAGGGACCGDDASEYVALENTYSASIAFDNNENACCNLADDCVAGSTCYTPDNNPIDGTTSLETNLNVRSSDTMSYCYDNGATGAWLECDQSDYMDYWCGEVCGPEKGNVNPRGSVAYPGWNSVYSGEAVVGEYPDTTTLGCCGDDETGILNGRFEVGSSSDAYDWSEDTNCGDNICFYRINTGENIDGYSWYAKGVSGTGWDQVVVQKTPALDIASTSFTFEFDYNCVTATASNGLGWHMRFRPTSSSNDARDTTGIAYLDDGTTAAKNMDNFLCSVGEKGHFIGVFNTASSGATNHYLRIWHYSTASQNTEIVFDNFEVYLTSTGTEYNVKERGGDDVPSGFNDGISTCCNQGTSCSKDGTTCYATSSTTGTIPTKAYCNGGQWIGGDASSTACTAIGTTWIAGGANKCCGDDGASDDFSAGANQIGCCCDGSQIGENDNCQSYGQWCIDGSYCSSGIGVDPALTAGGTTYTITPGGDDEACSCTSTGYKCDNDADSITEGICASSTCDTDLVAMNGGTYYSTCTDGYECDSDVTPSAETPRYLRTGYCLTGSCIPDGTVVEGNACNHNAQCSDATYARSCFSGYNANCAGNSGSSSGTCRRNPGLACTTGNQCGSGVCTAGTCNDDVDDNTYCDTGMTCSSSPIYCSYDATVYSTNVYIMGSHNNYGCGPIPGPTCADDGVRAACSGGNTNDADCPENCAPTGTTYCVNAPLFDLWGYCVDTTQSDNACGGCANDCEALANVQGTSPTCTSSLCNYVDCADGYADTNGDTGCSYGSCNGCEDLCEDNDVYVDDNTFSDYDTSTGLSCDAASNVDCLTNGCLDLEISAPTTITTGNCIANAGTDTLSGETKICCSGDWIRASCTGNSCSDGGVYSDCCDNSACTVNQYCNSYQCTTIDAPTITVISQTDQPLNSELGKIIITMAGSLPGGYEYNLEEVSPSAIPQLYYGTSTTYTHSSLNDNTRYCYRARIQDASTPTKYSSWSSTVCNITKDRTGPTSATLTLTPQNSLNRIDTNFTEGDTGLVLYLPFEEGTGTTTQDWSVEDNDGTLASGTTWITGRFGKGINCSASSAPLSVSGVSLGTGWTATLWSYFPLETSGSTWKTLFRSSSNDHHVIVQNDGLLGMYDNDGGGFRSCGFDVDTLSTGWHHLAAIGSGTTTDFYIDGEYTCQSSDVSFNAIDNICSWSSTQHWGTFDELRIYNTVLTQSQIIDVMQSGLIRKGLYRSATSGGTYEPVDGLLDDFSSLNGSIWVDQAATPTVSGGELILNAADEAVHTSNLYNNVVVEIKLKSATTGDSARFGLADSNYLGYPPTDDPTNADAVFYHHWNNGYIYTDVKKAGAGNNQQVQDITYDTNYHIYKIIYIGGKSVKFFEDDILLEEHTANVPDVNLGIWLSSDSTITTTIDWVKVTPLISENTYQDTGATDVTAPGQASGLSSSSHTTSTWSNDSTIQIDWTTDATDTGDDYFYYLTAVDDEGNNASSSTSSATVTTGLDGYNTSFTVGETDISSATKDVEDAIKTKTSSTLADGNNWYFNIKSVDNGGNWDANADTLHYGPFYIDTADPTTSITSPASGSMQNTDFNVSISDSDSLSDINTNACTYRILDNGVQSLGWTSRTCNADITVDISQYCTTQGSNKCTVEAKSTDNAGNLATTASRSFGIITCPSLTGNSFIIKSSSSGFNCFTFDQNGYGKLRGTLTESCSSTPPSSSYIIKDSSGTVNLWVSPACNMCIRGNVFFDQIINTSGTGNFYITNSTGNYLLKVDSANGNLYVKNYIGVGCTT